jgi:hypothetical protein
LSAWVANNSAIDSDSTATLPSNHPPYAVAVWAAMSNPSWAGCVEARPNGYEETDDAPSAGTPDTLFVPYFEPDGPNNPPYSGYTSYVSDGVTGVQDVRLKNSAKYNGQNKSNPNADCNMQTIVPLSNNKVLLQSKVAGMVSTGYTHIALGASWAWRTLSPTAPYTEGSDYNHPDWIKAMVFLTDGLNTVQSNNTWHKSTYTAYNYLIRGQLGTTSAATAAAEQDTRTRLVCARMKDLGIRIYSILLEEQAQTAKDLMEDCASDPSLYFESPSSAELTPVFQAIAQDLSNLRLSQ